MEASIELIKNRSDIGAGTRGADLGVDAMEVAAINKGSYFFQRYPFVDVPTRNDSIYEHDATPFAKHIRQIYQQCKRVSSAVEDTLLKTRFPLVFSGDHSSAIGSISGIKSVFRDNILGVVWIDAHADIHSPYTTPSGNLHGMPLAAVLGQDNLPEQINTIDEETRTYWQKLKSLGMEAAKVAPEHLVYFGVRDTEAPEDQLIDELGIRNFKVEEVRLRGIGECVQDAVQRLTNCDVIYISFDVDSMDSEQIADGTGTPVPRGFMPEEIIGLLRGLFSTKKTVCMEIVEVNPLLDKQGNKMAEVAFDILECIEQDITTCSSGCKFVDRSRSGSTS